MVACEPRVGLDGERVAVSQRFLAALDRRGEAVAVTLVGEIALELRDEQAAVREDQYAEGARGLDETGRSNGLARCSRMAEPIAPCCTRVRAGVLLVLLDLFVENVLDGFLRRLVVFFRFSVDVDHLGDDAVSVWLRFLLVRGDQFGEHAGERIDLVAAQLGTGSEVRLLLGEHALEAEHQAVLDLPAGRGRATSALDLCESVVQRAPARRRRRQDLGGILALTNERLARPGFGSEGVGHQAVRRLRLCRRLLFDLLHGRSV